MDARFSPYDWLEFYQKHFPWVKSLVFCNHSHQPGIYDSRYFSDVIFPNDYSRISNKLISGVEVNILKDGKLDLNDNCLKTFKFVLGAINPMRVEYGDDSKTKRDSKEIEESICKVIQSQSIDAFSSLVSVIDDEIFDALDWDKIFDIANKYDVAIEIALMKQHPEWWLKKLAKNGCQVFWGTDWHGAYHFRKFIPKGCTEDEIAIINRVNEIGGRNGYDILNSKDKKTFDSIYKNYEMDEHFYDWFAEEILKTLDYNIQTDKILNY